LTIKNCFNEIIFQGKKRTASGFGASFNQNLMTSSKRAFEELEDFKYSYNQNLTPLINYPEVEKIEISEEELMDYFDNNRLKPIEGIYKNSEYRIAIKRYGFEYKGIVLKSKFSHWKKGDVKMIIEPTAAGNIYSFQYFDYDKISTETFATLKKDVILEVDIKFSEDESSEAVSFLKLYPSSVNNSESNKTSDGSWAGNGSGIIISKSGYIVTNYHVIKDADDIEVEFILNEEIQKFNAEVVQVDKTNDLAIIKIVDMNFDGLGELPYNFKTRSSDVGTKVYAFGYPMALSIMGKEIKVTSGIISSKSGIDGNITTYGIDASILPGNSGGPLFDDKGNFIGINSSGLARLGSETTGYTIKSSYVLNLIDVLPKSIELPSNTKLESLPLTEQIKEISKYVVLIKVK